MNFKQKPYVSIVLLAFMWGSPLAALAQTPDGSSSPTPLSPVSPVTPASQPQGKIRVAVLDFDFSSVSDPNILATYPGQSKGVSDILVNKLVQSGKYSVVERSQIEAVLREQNLGASGRVDASTAAQIGKILGVDIVIIGSVTEFNLQQQRSGGGIPGISASTTDVDANVRLNVRGVNTTTAEIMFAAEGKGNASQSGSSVSVFGIGGDSSTENSGKLLSQASEQAVDQVVQGIDGSYEKLATGPKALPAVNALVADIAGNTVILNKGQTDGYRSGMKISIERVTRQVKDPVTGKVIREVTQPIGIVELTEVDASSSVGTVISGSRFKVGDLAKPTN